jgi:hypothetical protein
MGINAPKTPGPGSGNHRTAVGTHRTIAALIFCSADWKETNWHCIGPMIGVLVACNSTSTFQIDYTRDDFSGK